MKMKCEKTDCFAFRRSTYANNCTALSESVQGCPFYKSKDKRREEIRRLKEAGFLVLTTEKYQELMSGGRSVEDDD